MEDFNVSVSLSDTDLQTKSLFTGLWLDISFLWDYIVCIFWA